MAAQESKLENYFCTRARSMGAEVRKLEWINQRGAPDRVVFYKGLVLFIEFKAPGEKLRPEQEREHERLRAQGANIVVVDSTEKADSVLRFMEHV